MSEKESETTLTLFEARNKARRRKQHKDHKNHTNRGGKKERNRYFLSLIDKLLFNNSRFFSRFPVISSFFSDYQGGRKNLKCCLGVLIR